MTAAKWLQFLEHVQMRWPNLPVRHAKVRRTCGEYCKNSVFLRDALNANSNR